jgi:hypothetical protein
MVLHNKKTPGITVGTFFSVLKTLIKKLFLITRNFFPILLCKITQLFECGFMLLKLSPPCFSNPGDSSRHIHHSEEKYQNAHRCQVKIFI